MQQDRNNVGTGGNQDDAKDVENQPDDVEKNDEVTDEIESLKDALSAARKEAADNYDRFLRLGAEFENYKKRVQRQMDDHRKYSNTELIKDLLPVVDNLERAIAAYHDNRANIESCMVEGVEMTLKEVLNILEKHNATQVEAQGKPFDPNYHEAVMQEESEQHPENTVINELQKGYLLHDRLIRPSMVVVSKGSSTNQSK